MSPAARSVSIATLSLVLLASTLSAQQPLPRATETVTDCFSAPVLASAAKPVAYRVQSDGSDRTRHIAVKTRNPEYVVRMRTQFVEKSDETRMRDRLTASLFRARTEPEQIAIGVTAGKARKGRRNYTVPVQVRIPIAQFTALSGNGKTRTGSFSVYVGVATELNALSDVTQKTQSFTVPGSQWKKALASHFTYELDVEVDAKSKYLAVGVFD